MAGYYACGAFIFIIGDTLVLSVKDKYQGSKILIRGPVNHKQTNSNMYTPFFSPGLSDHMLFEEINNIYRPS